VPSRAWSFFDQLDALFPAVERPDPFANDLVELAARGSAPTLQVHRVGAFEASFVPSRADFGRLDPRFRLPDEVLAGLPYDDSWGHAVFKLQGAGAKSRRSTPARRGLGAWLSSLLGGRHELAKLARFDHQLYFQADGDPELQKFMLPAFELIRPDPSESPWPEDFDPRIQVLHRSRGPLGAALEIDALIDPEQGAWRYSLEGTGPNQDLRIVLNSSIG